MRVVCCMGIKSYDVRTTVGVCIRMYAGYRHLSEVQTNESSWGTRS
jgi:hypothetical protein